MEKTTVYIPREMQASLKALAKRTGRSQADLMREALELYVRGQQRQLPSFVGIIKDGSLQARDVEDWLNQNWHAD